MNAVRLYIHENGTFPRGDVTLPVVANLSKAVSFVITYTRIETHYLAAPYVHKCRDYTAFPDSRVHCISACIRRQTLQLHNAVPADHLLTSASMHYLKLGQKNSSFVSPDEDFVRMHELACSGDCSLGCITKTFYTTLSEASLSSTDASGSGTFDVTTRFENPETSVKFIPRLDLQAYVIYVASVFGIWFSASIYHLSVDLASGLQAAFKFLQLLH